MSRPASSASRSACSPAQTTSRSHVTVSRSVEHHHLCRGLGDRRHPASGAQLTAVRGDQPGEGPGDVRVVHDAGGRKVQRAEADYVGLEVGQLRAAHPPARDAVDRRPLLEGGHPFDLLDSGRDDQLAAFGEQDAVLPAEVLGGTFTGLAERRLEAAGLVIDPGVDHPAVVPGLVRAHRLLGFEHYDGGSGSVASRW